MTTTIASEHATSSDAAAAHAAAAGHGVAPVKAHTA